jgi:hypothetical protein
MAYTTVAAVRLMHYLFDIVNVPTANIESFIADGDKHVNDHLGLTTNMSDADMGKCGADIASKAYACASCIRYLGPEYFDSVKNYDAALKSFETQQEQIMVKVGVKKGTAIEPTFNVRTNG